MIKGKLNPIHPGEVLLEEFLKPMNIPTSQIAQDLKISQDIAEDQIDEKIDKEVLCCIPS